jgi:SAM-dependent methyltransferase
MSIGEPPEPQRRAAHHFHHFSTAVGWDVVMRDYTVPSQVAYLDEVAATSHGRDYKRRLLEALDPRPGQVALDIGCGPGTDLAALADAVGACGHVIGVDRDPVMVERASERTHAYPWIETRLGDAHALPVSNGSIDRARADRVLQHLEDAGQALAEVRRVLRAGGIVGLAEPDCDALVIDDTSPELGRALAAFIGARVRNRAIGRQLPRLCTGAGLEVSTVDATALVLRDPAMAEQLLGLRRNVVRAVRAGALPEAAADGLLERLAAGPMLACVVVWTVTAIRPQ